MKFASNLPRNGSRFICLLGLVLGFLCPTANSARATQTSSGFTASMLVTATTSSSTPYITLNWTNNLPIGSTITSVAVYTRVKGTTNWGSPVTLANPTTVASYADSNALPGVTYEYSLTRTYNYGSSVDISQRGAVVSGYNIPLVDKRGDVLLLMDNTITTPLAPQIAQLESDLAADGWTVYPVSVARGVVAPAAYSSTTATEQAIGASRLAELTATLTAIQNTYNQDPTANWSLFILGHVPIAYSGLTYNDGHTQHLGAWPTDLYYGTLGQGGWTDTTVNTFTDQYTSNGKGVTTTTDPRNYNVPGDGKFDQSNLAQNAVYDSPLFATSPTDVFECGRVDLYNMTSVPPGLTVPTPPANQSPAQSPAELDLLSQYLTRDHQYRIGAGGYASVQNAGIVDENFNSAEAASLITAATSFYGTSSMNDQTWFPYLSTNPVKFAYGSGGGQPTNCQGVGSSTVDFAQSDTKAVFYMVYGSYFSDFDQVGDFQNAPLAGTSGSLGLASLWSEQDFFLQHMGVGETIGYSTRFSYNEATNEANTGNDNTWNMYQDGSVCESLMGDPTLRLQAILPPTGVSVSSGAGGVTLSWTASADTGLAGYHVYRATSALGPFTRLTGGTPTVTDPMGSPIAGTTYTDNTGTSGTAYYYQVKAVRMEGPSTGLHAGTYANMSLGATVSVASFTTSATSAPANLVVTDTGSATYSLAWSDPGGDATSYHIQRYDSGSQTWSTIGTSTTTSYVDSTAVQPATASTTTPPLTYLYQVTASGASGTSGGSNVAGDSNTAGIIYANTNAQVIANNYFQVVPKSVVTVSLQATRGDGTLGAVSVSYTTTPVLGTLGTDFTAPASGTLSWAEGVTGAQTISVGATNFSTPQLTKLLQVTYSNPTNGSLMISPSTALYPNANYLAIQDPSVQGTDVTITSTTTGGVTTYTATGAPTFNAQWYSGVIGGAIPGSPIDYPGYSEYLNGTFGLMIRGFAFPSDSMRYVYQPVTGNFQMVARLVFGNTAMLNPGFQAGLTVRSDVSPNPAEDATVMQDSGTIYRYERASAGVGTNTTKSTSGHSIPQWFRITRNTALAAPDNVKSEYSADGVNWTTISYPPSNGEANLPATAYVGMMATSNTGATAFNVAALPNPDQRVYAQFDNVALYQQPTTPTNFTAVGGPSSGQIALNWSAVTNIQSYQINRTTTSGSGYVPVATVAAGTTTYTDTGLTAGQTYYYQIAAVTPTTAYGASAYSADISAIATGGGTAATVTLGNLTTTYNGSPQSATATTSPSGLAVAFTYNGSSTAPTAAGSYTVVGTVTTSGYSGSATGTMVISQATATVTLGNLSVSYTGSPQSATATTTPSGLAVTFTYNGSSTPPTLVGSYPVVGTVNDPNYTGSASGTMVIANAGATVTLGNLAPTYTGSALSATATTSPSGLAVAFTYNGSSTAPTAAGSYTVVGTVTTSGYTGSATGTMVIGQATATVTLGNLSVSYTGSPQSATATTTPSGLAVTFTYNGSSTAPTAVGSYTVVGTVSNANYAGSATGTMVISSGTTATVTLGNLAPTYTGSPQSATATTTPSGLTVAFTYNGSSTAPTAAGSYTVVGTVTTSGYTGSATGTMVISPATATVTLGNLTVPYTGSPQSATATTTPSGLTVTFTYNGSSTPPTAAGSYTVVGTVSNANYTGSATGTMVISSGSATVTLGNLSPTYTGTPQSATATTTPSGLTVAFTYNGSSTAPTAAGSYTVVGTVTTSGYSGSATGTMVIGKATATVTLGNLSPTYNGVGQAATATTVPAGLTVTFTYNGLSGNPPTHAGSYTVVGTVSDPNYTGSATGTEVIAKATATVTLGNLTAVYNGSPQPATATTNPTGLSVTLTYNGSSTVPSAVGSYTVVGIIPAGGNYMGSATGTLVISANSAATVTLGNLAVTYNGSPQSATATTSPSGLSVAFTYNGSTIAPTAAGSYTVVGTITSTGYTGSATGTMVISQATATVTLGSLADTYSGSPQSATSTTSPSGLNVTYTYNGSSTAPTAAGSYAVVGTVNDPNYTGSATGTLVIAKGSATVTLGGLADTYNGSPQPATATSSPSGLSVTFTYNGNSTAPTAAGSYAVVGTVNDPNYTGSATGTLVIAKGTATVTLGGLADTYTGSAQAATATTSPSGLTVTFTYNGSATAPTAAGSYTVVGTVNDPNYTGSATGTLAIAKATATVTLGGLADTYTGSAEAATATTSPSGLTVTFTYNGSSTAPTNVGSYPVVGTVNDPNYTGSATGTLVISQATATVTLGNLSTTYNGMSQGATATTVPAGLTVTFAYNGVSGNPPTHANSYTVVATVSNANYTGTATGTLVIAKAAATVTLGNLSVTYNGSPQPVTVTTSPTGLTVTVTYNGSTTAPTAVGSYAVVATVNNGGNYMGSATGTLVISPPNSPDLATPPSFSKWEGQYFSTAQMNDATVSGASATPQNDGVTNLIKYLYNIDPAEPMTSADCAALPVEGTTTINSVSYLTLTYRQYGLETGITINVQTSSDLKTWQTVTPDFSQQAGTDANTGDPVMEVGVNLNSTTRKFIRLNVTNP